MQLTAFSEELTSVLNEFGVIFSLQLATQDSLSRFMTGTVAGGPAPDVSTSANPPHLTRCLCLLGIS